MEEPTPSKREQPHTEAELRRLITGIVSEILANASLQPPTPLQPPGPPPPPAPPANRRRRILTAVLAVLVAALALYHLGRSPLLAPGSRRVPDELLGMWETSAPRYVNRAFEIRPTQLILHAGATSVTIHPIRRIEVVRRHEGTLYTISYLTADEALQFSFYYEPPPREAIRFRYQEEMAWRKAKR